MKKLSHKFGRAPARLLSRAAMIVASAAKRSAHIAYHVLIVALSAGIALSLPAIAGFLARNFLYYWSLIED